MNNDGYTVAELCASVGQAVSDSFPEEVWIKGVISGLTRSANGHVYFDLVDPSDLGHAPEATLPVALFARSKHRVNAILRKSNAARMADGVEIRIRGEVAYYAKQGRVQLLMSLIDPAYTLGQIEAAKNQLLATLASEGLLAANKQLPLPVPALCIGLITSVGSAAEADFVDELERSRYSFAITRFDTRVQGNDAPHEIADALARAGATPALDAVVVVRGGGARSDLVAFDHEIVARAIAQCPRPVVTGIGHEVDRSVADEVANHALKTPTACAGFFIDQATAFERRLDQGAVRLGRAVQAQVERQHHLLATAEQNLLTQTARVLEQQRHRLALAAVRCETLDPATILARGWSITRTLHGDLIRSTREAAPDQPLQVQLADGTMAVIVKEPAITREPAINKEQRPSGRKPAP